MKPEVPQSPNARLHAKSRGQNDTGHRLIHVVLIIKVNDFIYLHKKKHEIFKILITFNICPNILF